MNSTPKRTVRYFISYTREDGGIPDQFLTELRSQLSASNRYEFVPWRDTEILPGENWHEEIQRALNECDFGLLLVSPAFLGNSYIAKHELPGFVDGAKPCIPVLLRRIDLKTQDLRGLDPLQFFGYTPPRDARPRSFEECTSAKHRTAFAHTLFKAIVGRLDKHFGYEPGPESSADEPDALAFAVGTDAEMPQGRFDEFLNTKSMATPVVAGALTTMIANTLFVQFGLPSKWVALAVSVMFAAVVVLKLRRCPVWQMGLYTCLCGLLVYAVATGMNSLGEAALGHRTRQDPVPIILGQNHGYEYGTSEMQSGNMPLSKELPNGGDWDLHDRDARVNRNGVEANGLAAARTTEQIKSNSTKPYYTQDMDILSSTDNRAGSLVTDHARALKTGRFRTGTDLDDASDNKGQAILEKRLLLLLSSNQVVNLLAAISSASSPGLDSHDTASLLASLKSAVSQEQLPATANQNTGVVWVFPPVGVRTNLLGSGRSGINSNRIFDVGARDLAGLVAWYPLDGNPNDASVSGANWDMKFDTDGRLLTLLDTWYPIDGYSNDINGGHSQTRPRETGVRPERIPRHFFHNWW